MDLIHAFEMGLQEFLDSGFQQLGVAIVFLYQIIPQKQDHMVIVRQSRPVGHRIPGNDNKAFSGQLL